MPGEDTGTATPTGALIGGARGEAIGEATGEAVGALAGAAIGAAVGGDAGVGTTGAGKALAASTTGQFEETIGEPGSRTDPKETFWVETP